MTGFASHLPYSVARRVVPLLPRRAQRFQPASSWESAVRQSVGYEATRHEVPPSKDLGLDPQAPLGARDLQIIAGIGSAIDLVGSKSRVRVVDLGGYHGGHRAVAVRAFPRMSFEWTVVELPDIVRSCRGLVSPDLAFTSDLNHALDAGADICLASASLNYVADPVSTLASMIRTAVAVVLLRLPLWPIAQHSPAIQRLSRHSEELGYPTWFFSETQFRREVSSIGSIVMSFDIPEDRAYFAGHYGCYQGLVIAGEASGA